MCWLNGLSVGMGCSAVGWNIGCGVGLNAGCGVGLNACCGVGLNACCDVGSTASCGVRLNVVWSVEVGPGCAKLVELGKTVWNPGGKVGAGASGW